MAKKKSELEALRESVHSLAKALTLLRDIFLGQGAAFNSDPFKKFTEMCRMFLLRLLSRGNDGHYVASKALGTQLR